MSAVVRAEPCEGFDGPTLTVAQQVGRDTKDSLHLVCPGAMIAILKFGADKRWGALWAGRD
jgi:hypothetical protein